MTTRKKDKTISSHPSLKHMLTKIGICLVGIVLAVLLFNTAYGIYYHRDDMRNRPIGSAFEYLGRNYNSAYLFYGYIRMGAPTEVFYYGIDVPLSDIATALPGFEVNTDADVGPSSVKLRKKGDTGHGAEIRYLTDNQVQNATRTDHFHLKETHKKYIVEVSEGLMYEINQANIDPEIIRFNNSTMHEAKVRTESQDAIK